MQKIPIRGIKERPLENRFNITKLESLLSENDMIQELHRHAFFFVLFLKDGNGEHIIDFTPYPVKKNSIFFMRPGQVHQLQLKKGSAGYLMQFDQNFYSPQLASSKSIFKKVSHKNYYSLHAEKFQKLLLILSNINEEHSQKQAHYEEVIKANLKILFIEIVRQSRHTSTVSKKTLYSQERLEEFLELVENHLSSHKSIAEYAEMMHLSTFQLNKITKETLGKTSSQILNEQILLEAKRNLLGTLNQINQIAYELGYEDSSYFIRFFKKHTGISPEVFRKNFK